MTTIRDLVLALAATEPTRPRLTWYGTAGERVELSSRVLTNTVVKATTSGGTVKTVAATDSAGSVSIVLTNGEDHPQMVTVSGFANGSVRGRITSEKHDLAEVNALEVHGGSFSCVLPPKSVVSLRE